jgi:ATP-dependent helicase/nuclease subunit A
MFNIKENINPKKSIFVSANAGSGKTFALVSRVLGLLLNGEDPTKILCISYTEAACFEMQERILQTLKNWYHGEIENDLILKQASPSQLEKAKKLYEDVILLNKKPKILTFHAFCMQIIQTFSVESNIPYKSKILNINSHHEIEQKILMFLVQNKETNRLINELRSLFSMYSLTNIIIPEIFKTSQEHIFLNTKDTSVIFDYLGFAKGEETEDFFLNNFIKNFPFDELKQIIILYDKDSSKSQKVNNFLNLDSFAMSDFYSIKQVFLTKDDEPKKSPFGKSNDEISVLVAHVQEYLKEQIELLKKMKTLFSTIRLSSLSAHIIEYYKEWKRSLEGFDFNDLIEEASKALKGEDKDFILFKLDGGLRHILVDEAQDTNEIQWEILHNILEEFFAGSEEARSLFVVGDVKQSIFSFQGSDIEALLSVKKKYQNNFVIQNLQTSFRSTKPILDFVDSIFSQECYSKLISKEEYQNHFTNIDDFGRIEIYNLEVLKQKLEDLSTNKKSKDTEEDFIIPKENEDQENLSKKITAEAISKKIIEILDEGRIIKKTGLKVKPSDFMLLIQKRDSVLFDYLKDFLKERNVEISFHDRIKLNESTVINDFIFLLKYLLNSSNTLALGVVLRSPMFKVIEQELYNILITQNHNIVDEILELKSFLLNDLKPFFIKIIAKFGFKYTDLEVKEISYIFTLIDMYEESSTHSNFEGFVNFFDIMYKNEHKFKIDSESKENAVNASTVHGSKGLESTIVFILNANSIFSKSFTREKIVTDQSKNIFLLSNKDFECEEWLALKEEKRQFAFAEYIRLFYVALTRAREEIYIFPSLNIKSDTEFDSWYEIAVKALPNLKVTHNKPVIIEESKVELPKVAEILIENTNINLKNIVFTKATKTLKDEINLQFGSAIHEMLDKKTKILNLQYFVTKFNLLKEQDILFLWNKANLIKEKFAFLFAHDVLSEVEIIQEEKENFLFRGKIDKLLITNEVHIYDFKYQKTDEDGLIKIRSQIKMYVKAIKKIYPEKNIKCFILWLKEEELEEFFV